jgi:hypothetical protein
LRHDRVTKNGRTKHSKKKRKITCDEKTVLKPQEKRKLGNAGGYAPHADKTARVRAREGVPDATAWGDCENNITQCSELSSGIYCRVK